jgi:hypothetical protein
VLLADRRHDFEPGDDLLDLGRDVALDRPHHHVLPAQFAPAALIEHAQRLADARGVAQKHFEPAAPRPPLFRLDAPQQFLGIRPLIGSIRHCSQDKPGATKR